MDCGEPKRTVVSCAAEVVSIHPLVAARLTAGGPTASGLGAVAPAASPSATSSATAVGSERTCNIIELLLGRRDVDAMVSGCRKGVSTADRRRGPVGFRYLPHLHALPV